MALFGNAKKCVFNACEHLAYDSELATRAKFGTNSIVDLPDGTEMPPV